MLYVHFTRDSENTKVRDKYQESLTNLQKDSMFYLEIVPGSTA